VIVLDTNVVSELMRATPEREVLAWLRRHPVAEVSTTAVTLAEVRYGIARLPEGDRKRRLWAGADRVFAARAELVLPFDAAAAAAYAEVVAHRERLGRPIAALDAQIAAVCRVRDATLATRDVADFRDTGVDVVNPWQA